MIWGTLKGAIIVDEGAGFGGMGQPFFPLSISLVPDSSPDHLGVSPWNSADLLTSVL